MAKGKGNAL